MVIGSIDDTRTRTETHEPFRALHAKTVDALVRSLHQLEADTRNHAPHAQTDFIARSTHILGDAYLEAHRLGQHDYWSRVSLIPSIWQRAIPNNTDIANVLQFYVPSIGKMAREIGAMPHHSAVIRMDELDTWMHDPATEQRVILQADLTWSGFQQGYIDASNYDTALPYQTIFWNLDPSAAHCGDCPDIAMRGPYGPPGSGLPELPSIPGDGHTQCGARCRCDLSYGQSPDTGAAQWGGPQFPPDVAAQLWPSGADANLVQSRMFIPSPGDDMTRAEMKALDDFRRAYAQWQLVRQAWPEPGTMFDPNSQFLNIPWDQLNDAQQQAATAIYDAIDAYAVASAPPQQTMQESVQSIQLMNPNHDALGRFAEGTSWGLNGVAHLVKQHNIPALKQHMEEIQAHLGRLQAAYTTYEKEADAFRATMRAKRYDPNSEEYKAMRAKNAEYIHREQELHNQIQDAQQLAHLHQNFIQATRGQYGPSAIYHPDMAKLAVCHTTNDVQNWLKTTFPDTQFYLDGVHADHALAIAHELADVGARFPTVMQGIHAIGSTEDARAAHDPLLHDSLSALHKKQGALGVCTYDMHSGTSSIMFNGRMLHDTGTLETLTNNAISKGFWFQGNTHMGVTMRHEFAHAIENHMDYHPTHAYYPQALRMQYTHPVDHMPSGYAKANNRELWAESFAGAKYGPRAIRSDQYSKSQAMILSPLAVGGNANSDTGQLLQEWHHGMILSNPYPRQSGGLFGFGPGKSVAESLTKRDIHTDYAHTAYRLQEHISEKTTTTIGNFSFPSTRYVSNPSVLNATARIGILKSEQERAKQEYQRLTKQYGKTIANAWRNGEPEAFSETSYPHGSEHILKTDIQSEKRGLTSYARSMTHTEAVEAQAVLHAYHTQLKGVENMPQVAQDLLHEKMNTYIETLNAYNRAHPKDKMDTTQTAYKAAYNALPQSTRQAIDEHMTTMNHTMKEFEMSSTHPGEIGQIVQEVESERSQSGFQHASAREMTSNLDQHGEHMPFTHEEFQQALYDFKANGVQGMIAETGRVTIHGKEYIVKVQRGNTIKAQTQNYEYTRNEAMQNAGLRALGMEDISTGPAYHIAMNDNLRYTIMPFVHDAAMAKDMMDQYGPTFRINADDVKRASIAEYVLGIGDRHEGNILVKSDGHLVEIDLGIHLGSEGLHPELPEIIENVSPQQRASLSRLSYSRKMVSGVLAHEQDVITSMKSHGASHAEIQSTRERFTVVRNAYTASKGSISFKKLEQTATDYEATQVAQGMQSQQIMHETKQFSNPYPRQSGGRFGFGCGHPVETGLTKGEVRHHITSVGEMLHVFSSKPFGNASEFAVHIANNLAQLREEKKTATSTYQHLKEQYGKNIADRWKQGKLEGFAETVYPEQGAKRLQQRIWNKTSDFDHHISNMTHVQAEEIQAVLHGYHTQLKGVENMPKVAQDLLRDHINAHVATLKAYNKAHPDEKVSTSKAAYKKAYNSLNQETRQAIDEHMVKTNYAIQQLEESSTHTGEISHYLEKAESTREGHNFQHASPREITSNLDQNGEQMPFTHQEFQHALYSIRPNNFAGGIAQVGRVTIQGKEYIVKIQRGKDTNSHIDNFVYTRDEAMQNASLRALEMENLSTGPAYHIAASDSLRYTVMPFVHDAVMGKEVEHMYGPGFHINEQDIQKSGIAEYVLGIGDRHPGNVLVRPNGHIVEIDLGSYIPFLSPGIPGALRFASHAQQTAMHPLTYSRSIVRGVLSHENDVMSSMRSHGASHDQLHETQTRFNILHDAYDMSPGDISYDDLYNSSMNY